MEVQEHRYPILLDGGLSNQLERQGCHLNQPLWTAMILKTDPEQVLKAHLAYLHAGAQCIITASYQASIAGFRELGFSSEEAEALIRSSVQIATTAVDLHLAEHPDRSRALIAASIGPYGAFLADGSEYIGKYVISDEELLDFHSARLQVLDDSDADFIACETIPSFREAQVLSHLLKDSRKKAWITFSCRDESHIRDGTPLESCIRSLSDHPNIFALGVNCTEPRYISDLLTILRETVGNKRIVVYPNSGETYNPDTKSWIKSESVCFSPELVRSWLNEGADIVGGCCQVGPEMIRKLSTSIVEFRST